MAYCHDSVGIGHVRRTHSICEHVGALLPRSCFLLATGTPYLHTFRNLPRVDSIKLPALTKTDNGEYASKFLNLSSNQMMQCRKSLLRHAAEHFRPHVLLIDKAPLGVCRELVPTLSWLRVNRPNTRIVFGMRDVEDESTATIHQWSRDGVQEALVNCFDEIWVYGNRSIFDVCAEYDLPRGVQQKLRYVGYVCRGACDHAPSNRCDTREILVTVGGGTDGERVLSTFLDEAAAKVARHGFRTTLIGGQDLPDDVASRLKEKAERIEGATWIDVEHCMSCRMQHATLVVAMGGYNTMCEVIAHRKNALIIPREKPRLEQVIRAERWSERSLISVLRYADLSPTSLANRVLHLLYHNCEPPAELDMTGLKNVGERFVEFAKQDKNNAIAVRL
jgi:predicted glycosyltransferase